jgi:hypothetical protein
MCAGITAAADVPDVRGDQVLRQIVVVYIERNPFC